MSTKAKIRKTDLPKEFKNIVLDIGSTQTEIERREIRVDHLKENLKPVLKKLLEKETGALAYVDYPEEDMAIIELEFSGGSKEEVFKAVRAAISIRSEIVANSCLEVELRLYYKDCPVDWRYEKGELKLTCDQLGWIIRKEQEDV